MFNRRRSERDGALVLRVKNLVRQRFVLDENASILVAELTCALPGCPPLETLIAFWTAADHRHSFRIFKPLCEVTEEDLPPSWMKQALKNNDIDECC